MSTIADLDNHRVAAAIAPSHWLQQRIDERTKGHVNGDVVSFDPAVRFQEVGMPHVDFEDSRGGGPSRMLVVVSDLETLKTEIDNAAEDVREHLRSANRALKEVKKLQRRLDVVRERDQRTCGNF